MSEVTCPSTTVNDGGGKEEEMMTPSQMLTSVKEAGNQNICAGNQNFCRRQLSRHLQVKRKEEKVDKQVQTLISGDFFVNTANVYAGRLVE